MQWGCVCGDIGFSKDCIKIWEEETMELTLLFYIMVYASPSTNRTMGLSKKGRGEGWLHGKGGGDMGWGTDSAVDWEALLGNFKSNSF